VINCYGIISNEKLTMLIPTKQGDTLETLELEKIKQK
jgi:hypothetical protein